MSIPENISILMKAFKPKINRFKPGDLVVAKNDNSSRLRVVTQILPDGTYPEKTADYITAHLSRRGKPVFQAFNQNEIKTKIK